MALLFIDMAYNKKYRSHCIFKELYMKKCFYCNKEFVAVGPEKGCSIRCKLSGDVKKIKECWFFKSSSAGDYSKVRWKKKWYSAHRCSYEIFKGNIPFKMWVCHTCDNPKCINPDHLFLGSAKDNIKDCKKKGRNIKGERSHFSKYKDAQIEELKKLRKEGFSYERLSRIFNCTISYLNLLFNNKVRKG